jgi:hypothetical protein
MFLLVASPPQERSQRDDERARHVVTFTSAVDVVSSGSPTELSAVLLSIHYVAKTRYVCALSDQFGTHEQFRLFPA